MCSLRAEEALGYPLQPLRRASVRLIAPFSSLTSDFNALESQVGTLRTADDHRTGRRWSSGVESRNTVGNKLVEQWVSAALGDPVGCCSYVAMTYVRVMHALGGYWYWPQCLR